MIDLRLEEEVRPWRQPSYDPDVPKSISGHIPRTRIFFAVSPKTDRERRLEDTITRAREVLVSFRSYLMATEDMPDEESTGSESSDAAPDPVVSPVLHRWALAAQQDADSFTQRFLRVAGRILTPWRWFG